MNATSCPSLLAVDTVTEACSVALWSGERMITRFEEPGRGHALRVLPMIDAVLAEAGIKLQQLAGIAACVGPGAFTGVRLSVSVSQGLAFGAGIPVVPVTSLEMLALQAFDWSPAPTQVLACLDARMGELYWGRFRIDPERGVKAVGELRIGSPELVAPDADAAAGIGRGLRVLKALRPWTGRCDEDALPRAEHLARLGLLRLELGEGVDPAQIVPVYLRDKVAMTEAERAAVK